MKKLKTAWFYNFSLIVLYFIAVCAIFPPLRALSEFNYVWIFLLFLWFVLSFFAAPSFYLRINHSRLIAYVFFGYVVVFSSVFGSTAIANRYVELSQMLVFYWAYELSLKMDRVRHNLKVIYAVVPFVLVPIFVNLYAYGESPNIARTAKKDTVEGLSQMSMGVGGYDFIYFLCFLIVLCLYVSLDGKYRVKLFPRSVIALFLCLAISCVAYSNFATALMIVTFSLLVVIMIKRLSIIKALLLCLFIVLVIPLLPVFFLSIADILLYVFRDSMNASRIFEVRQLIVEGAVNSSLAARLDTYLFSLKVFIENPVFGIVGNGAASGAGVITTFGQHSLFLDGFALFGIFVGATQVYVFMSPLTREVSFSSLARNTLPLLMLFLVFMFFTVNNAVPSIGLVVYFMYPTLMYFTTTESKTSSPRSDGEVVC